MKRNLLHVFLLLIYSLGCFGQEKHKEEHVSILDLNSNFNYAFKIEYKLKTTANLYENGYYDHVNSNLIEINNLLKKQSVRWPSLVFQSKLLKIRNNNSVLEFDKANMLLIKLLNDLDQMPAGLVKDKLLILLATYYNEIGSYSLALASLENCNSLSKVINKSLLLSYEFEMANILVGQKNQELANKSILKIENYLIEDSLNQNTFEQKAKLVVLKAKYFLLNGNFEQAKALFNSQKEWLKNQPSALSQLLELEAEMYLQHQEYTLAFEFYKKAYSVLQISDYQAHKIYLLGQITILASIVDDVIAHSQYKRRLQMFADKNINKVNYFHLILRYTEAYSSFIEGNYETAIGTIEKANKKCRKLPPNHIYRNQLLSLQKEIFEEGAQRNQLESVLDSMSFLAKTYSGNNTPAYSETRLNKLNYNLKAGKNFSEIEKELLEIGKKHTFNVDSANLLSLKYKRALSQLYFQTDRFEMAAKESETALKFSAELHGTNSWEYALHLGQYIENLAWESNYAEALKKQTEFLALESELKSQKNSEQFLWFSFQAGKIAKLLGNFDQWKKYSLKANDLLSKQSKNTLLKYYEIKEQTASLYLETSNLIQAEKILNLSLANKLKHFGNSDPSLIPVYQDLLKLQILKGNYSQADNLSNKYSNLSSSIFGKTSIPFAQSLFASGKYFRAIGDYKRAKESFEACLLIQQNELGEQHLTESETFLELAQVNARLFPEKAKENEELYKKAGSIIKSAIGQHNALFADYQQLTADFYISTERFDQATVLLSKANSFWETTLGSKNIHSAEIAMMFGRIAYTQSNYSEAEIQYLKAKLTYEYIFNIFHPSASLATARLGKVYYMLNEKEKCISMMNQCMPNFLNYVHDYFPSLSFKEKTKFWLGMKDEFEFYNFLVLSGLSGYQKKHSTEVYNNIISSKALLLSSDIKLRKQIATSGDTTLIVLFEEWLSQKEQITAMLSLSKEQQLEQGLDIRQTELRLEQLEKEMGIRSNLFQSTSKKTPPKWRDVQAQLNDKEYAIELVRYRYFNKTFSDSVIYAALVVGKESKDGPDVVLFPEGSKMEKGYYKYYRNSVIKQVDDELSYKNFWQPIQSKIQDKALVYLSSDGVFNQINLEMLRDSAGKFVIDNTQIVQVTNTKDIIADLTPKLTSKAKSVKANDQIILCGNPAFYTKTVEKESVPSLVGAENEVNAIQEILQKENKNNLKLMNAQVTEDTLMSFRSPKALHIATHGFFKETLKSNLDDFNANPLLNSGLMLSGSGNILDNPTNNYVNASSGILTAYEALNMNLDNTEMVVLSACETGKGQVEAGEGVYGLQRAFLVAGANCVIISLFKVNDLVTKELMEEFYANWLKTNDKRSSFNDAKRKIKEKYDSPVYWGAFIMIEGKRNKLSLN